MLTRMFAVVAVCACSSASTPPKPAVAPQPDVTRYEYRETQELVGLVTDAARIIESEGEAAFAKLRVAGSRWRDAERYVFVLDVDGTMLVHVDDTMVGKNQRALADVHGRPIIEGLLHAATAVPGKPEGWYHYEWPVPNGLLPRWKSSFVRLVAAPSGKRYVVGSGIYNDRMERAFVVDMVDTAVAEIEARGTQAFARLHDRTGPFLAKDSYVFVIDPAGVELANPAFPNLEGRSVIDVKDTEGNPLVRSMLDVAARRGAGWVDYMWPKPGDSVSTKKSTYVRRARVGDSWLLVGAGVYLADAPRAAPDPSKPTAGQLVSLVRAGAALFEHHGEAAYAEFRERGSRWFRGDTYFIVFKLDGIRTLNAANPALEGKDVSGTKDILGRPYGRMFLDIAASPSGEGWVHYMFPEPGSLFPAWKSTFLVRVTAPSGEPYVIGCGIYNMEMDKAFIVDVVDRAAALVAAKGPAAFAELRDRTGPYMFMDTYVFVDTTDGVELVNPAQPSLEGKNLIDLRDVNGKAVTRESISAASKHGSAWVDYAWYRPGENTPARKQAYVRSVRFGDQTYIVGSGLYLED